MADAIVTGDGKLAHPKGLGDFQSRQTGDVGISDTLAIVPSDGAICERAWGCLGSLTRTADQQGGQQHLRWIG
jgi:hypothetical protein